MFRCPNRFRGPGRYSYPVGFRGPSLGVTLMGQGVLVGYGHLVNSGLLMGLEFPVEYRHPVGFWGPSGLGYP